MEERKLEMTGTMGGRIQGQAGGVLMAEASLLLVTAALALAGREPHPVLVVEESLPIGGPPGWPTLCRPPAGMPKYTRPLIQS